MQTADTPNSLNAQLPPRESGQVETGLKCSSCHTLMANATAKGPDLEKPPHMKGSAPPTPETKIPPRPKVLPTQTRPHPVPGNTIAGIVGEDFQKSVLSLLLQAARPQQRYALRRHSGEKFFYLILSSKIRTQHLTSHSFVCALIYTLAVTTVRKHLPHLGWDTHQVKDQSLAWASGSDYVGCMLCPTSKSAIDSHGVVAFTQAIKVAKCKGLPKSPLPMCPPSDTIRGAPDHMGTGTNHSGLSSLLFCSAVHD